MNILYITYPLAAMLIFVLVFGLAILIKRKYRLGWKLFFIGAAGFIISQVLRIPFNALVLNPLIENLVLPGMSEIAGIAVSALLLGVSTGLFEEFTRYGIYRWWAKDVRSWAKGVLLGTGWGGVEAILVAAIIGFLVLVMFGYIYAWDEARNWSAVEMIEYAPHLILGIMMLVGGLLAFIFVEE